MTMFRIDRIDFIVYFMIYSYFLYSLVAAFLSLSVGIVFGIIRRGEKEGIPKAIYWAFSINLLASLFLWFSFILPDRQGVNQRNTFPRMRQTREYLEIYHNRHKDYPVQLSDAIPAKVGFLTKDGWSHDLHYEHRPGAFILVSFGRDGQPDGIDYWNLRDSESLEFFDPESGSDYVLSDLGWHRTVRQ